MNRSRTLLAGVNDDFLDGVAALIAREPLLEVVGRAHSGSEVLEGVSGLRPDLVLADATLPDMSGFEVARRVASGAEPPVVVLMSFHDSQAARLEAWAAGAGGFVAKSEMADRLLPLVEELLRRRDERDRSVPSGKPVRVTDLREGGP